MSTTGVVDANRDELLAGLVELLARYEVTFILFGSEAGRLQGAELRTIDADIVPDEGRANLQKLCDALNTAHPRWRLDDDGRSAPIEGGRLEPRHLNDVVAMGLMTDVGPIDIVMRPKGFEAGYQALAPRAVHMVIGGVDVMVGDLSDLIRSKQLLDREKDREHLPKLIDVVVARQAHELDLGPSGPGSDPGLDLGL